MGEFEFDVFLCHNSQDKPTVIEIANQLKAKTIKPWLDDWELQPGLPWQPELQRQIQNIKSAAVFIGQNGIGPWQQREIESFLQEFDQRKCPVIPVLLPQAPQKEPELPLFLKSMTWVDFREGSSVYTDPLEKLVWGITGIKPVSQSIIQHKAIKRHNYSNLEELLNARNWGEADNVTFTIICTILDVEKKQPLYIKDIKNFLCTDLLTIEKLWLKYSNNRFGFSKQHQIWDNLLSTQTKQQQQEDYAWKTFLNEVGWNGKFISEQNAPEGHFPAIGTWFTAYQPGWLETLFSRLDTCIQSQTIKPLELLNSHLDYPPNTSAVDVVEIINSLPNITLPNDMSKEIALNLLQDLLPGQFQEVIFRYPINEAQLSQNVPQTTRAIEVIKFAIQTEGESLSKLLNTIYRVAPHLRRSN